MAKKTIEKKELLTYLGMLLIAGLGALGSRLITPHPTLVMEGDMSLSYPVNNSYPTVPYLVIAAIVPFILVTSIYGFTEKETQWNTAKVAYFFVLAFLFNEGATDIIKNVTGRPRPCFFQACGYPVTSFNGSLVYGHFGNKVDINKCTRPKEDVYEALRSYPSGHSSHTMVDGLYMFILLAELVHHTKWLNKTVKKACIIFLFSLCMSLPVYIGSSRIWDYKHRGEDVLAGYAVGAISTLCAYYMTFGWKWVRVKGESASKEPMPSPTVV